MMNAFLAASLNSWFYAKTDKKNKTNTFPTDEQH
jgi:hypothetical protein